MLQMNRIFSTIHLRFGLYRTRRDWMYFAAAWLLFGIASGFVSYSYVKIQAYLTEHDNFASKIKATENERKTYENVIITCLNRGIVIVGGKPKICEI